MINLGFYRDTQRENIYIRPSWIDRVLEVFALLSWISIWALAIVFNKRLMQHLPWFIWPVFASITTIVFIYGAYATNRAVKFPFRITDCNHWMQYFWIKKFVRIWAVIFNFLFLGLMFVGKETHWELRENFFEYISFGSLILFIITLCVYYVMAWRYRL